MNRPHLARLALLAGVVVHSAAAPAAVHCVDTAAGLLAAANAGFDDDEVSDVRIVQGTYQLAQSIEPPTSIGHLQLRGGYLPGCNARAPNPFNTVLDFTQAGTGAKLHVVGPKKFTMTWVTVQDAASIYAAAYNDVFDGPAIDVHNSVIRRIGPDAEFDHFPAVTLAAYEGTLDFRNNLVHGLVSPKAGCGLYFAHDSTLSVLVNNTFADLKTWTNGAANVCLVNPVIGSEPGFSTLTNNIVWSQPVAAGIAAAAGFTVNLVNNTFPFYAGPAPSLQTGTLATDPGFVNPASDNGFWLPDASSSVNSGTAFVVGGLSDVDLVNTERFVGSAPDRGAYESTFDDTTTMLVTNTNDSGAGSLRQALTTANASAGAKQVKFQIPGNCPHVIGLQTPLPDIQVPVHLRGRTQAGSTPNQSELGFDANICIVLHANTAAASRALRVPGGAANARLGVEGIAFSNFADRAIALEGGHDHVVAGNQFGGTMPGTPLAFNGSHLVVGAGVQRYTIGGTGVANRNLFGNSNVNFLASHGVWVQAGADGGIVTNNLIGLQRGLGSAAPNRIGLRVDADDTVVTGNLIAGNTGDGLAVNGDNATVQGNIIGYQNPAGTFGNNGAGVSLAGGAAGNSIGSLSLIGNPVADANRIAYNLAGGIHVRDSAGTGNLLRGNHIYGHANQPQIDLGTAGQDVNDAGDGDTGPNTRLNHPTITGVTFGPVPPDATNVAAQVTGTLQTAPGSYVVDVYGGTACTGGIGDTRHWLGSLILTVPNGGSTNFLVGVTLPKVSGYSISATTASSAGSTSETGVCFAVPPPNQPPTVASAIADQNSAEGQSVNLDLSNVFVDADGDALSLSLSAGSLPPGLSFNGTTISGVLPYAAAGFYNGLSITASDGKGGVVADTFNWTVLNTNQAPMFVGEPYAFAAAQGQPSNVIGSVEAIDADAGAVLQYSISAGNGAGLFAVDAASGQITAPAPAALIPGIHTLTLMVSDGLSGDSTNVQITVTPAGVLPDLIFRNGFE